MTKQEVITAVAQKTGATKKDTEQFLNTLGDVITEALVRDEAVRFIGFGSFETRLRRERNGKNPQTGLPMTIPAAKTVAFKCGKLLKASLR